MTLENRVASTAREVQDRLRKEVAASADPWPEMIWQPVAGGDGDGDGERLTLRDGAFDVIRLQPGRPLELSSRLVLPDRVQGVKLAGEPLELYVHTLYPLEVTWNGRSAFEGAQEKVAPGPALVQVVPELRAGDNGELQMKLDLPAQQLSPWLEMRFSTPGLRRRHEALDVAWSRLALASAVAASADEREAVRQAAALVPNDLAGLDGPALEEALAPMAEALAPLAERVRQLRVHIAGHSHIDMNWLWTWEDTRRVIERDLRTVTALLDEYPELTFTHSQAATYDVVRREDPDTFERIRRHVRAGRWEVACMQWVESDLNIPSGESLVRQHLEGVRFAREHLGVSPTTFLAPDTFGHAGNVPQLAVSAGAGRYYHHRCNPGRADYWPAYWWEGDDGTRLLVVSNHTYNGLITAGGLAAAAIHALRHGLGSSLAFHGIGDHGGGPTRLGLEALRRFQQLDGLPAAFCSTLTAYADEIERSGAPLPVHRGELNTVFEGCYTTQSDAKRRNREGEAELATAETLNGLAGRGGGEPLREAWQLVLFNQFHDILCGSSIHEAYEKNREDLERATEIARSVTERSLEALETGFEQGEVAVTNPLGWEREEPALVAGWQGEGPVWLAGDDGHLTPGQPTDDGLLFVARARPFATQRYRLTEAGSGTPGLDVTESASFIEVETPAFRARVHRASGALASLIDRRLERELVPNGVLNPSWGEDTARIDLAMGVLQLLDERYHRGSAWHLDSIHGETSLISGATTTVAERGPVRVVLATTHQVRRSRIVQRTIFHRSTARIDYETWVDWREPAGAESGFTDLKVAFPTLLEAGEAWFETPFAAVRRPASGREVPALRWADVGDGHYGIAVLNRGKHGYDALGARLRLTLLHGSSEPDEIADLGQHLFRYSLLPHAGAWREAAVVRAAAGLNQPLIARRIEERRIEAGVPVWRPQLEGSPSVLLSGMKAADGGRGVVLRLHESWGRAGEAALVLPEGAHACEVSVVEDPIGPLPVEEGRVRLPFRPWQVRSVMVETPG